MKSRQPTKQPSANSNRRRGQALIEFAVIAFVMTFLLGAMLAMGFLFFSANILQQAADVGAMEFARHPAAPLDNFDNALGNSGLFDEQFLFCAIGGTDTMEEDLPADYTPADYQALQDRMPLINRLLLPLYIYDPDWNALRYPGAVVERDDDDELTVLIPLVGFGNRDSNTGVETITEWRKVVEEIVPADSVSGRGAYSLNSMDTGTLEAGTVALRINYPYQSGALVAYQQQDSSGAVVRPVDALGQDDITNVFVEADDTMVTESAAIPGDYSLPAMQPSATIDGHPHQGRYVLGSMQAFATTVRPYRKVITAQGIYRREVFE